MRFYVVSVGDTTSPAFLTLGEQQQQTANCEVRNQKGRGKEGSGVTHPGAVSQFPRGRRGDKTPPNSTIHVAIRHSPALRRSPEENPALQAVVMALEERNAIGALSETWRRGARNWLRHRHSARFCHARHHRLRGAFRLRRYRYNIQRRLSPLRRSQTGSSPHQSESVCGKDAQEDRRTSPPRIGHSPREGRRPESPRGIALASNRAAYRASNPPLPTGHLD